jgi:hypothetical protein
VLLDRSRGSPATTIVIQGKQCACLFTSQMLMFYVPTLALCLPNIVELPVKFVAGKVRVQNGSSISGSSQSRGFDWLSTSVRILTVKAIRDVFSEEKVREVRFHLRQL